MSTEHLFEGDSRRVFPHHRDGYSYTGDPFVVEATIQDVKVKGTEAGADALRDFGPLNERAVRENLFHRTPNSFNDPMAVYFVLDAICESRRGIYLRPIYLVHFLTEQVPQFYWSVGVVGRIMAGFYHQCEEMYINDDINDDYIHVDEDVEDKHDAALRLLPFSQGRDSRGRFYVLDPEGGDEGLLWMLQARQKFLKEAMKAQEDDGVGKYKENWGKWSAPTDYFAEFMEHRTRPAGAYRNQLQGGASFQRPARPVSRGLNLGK